MSFIWTKVLIPSKSSNNKHFVNGKLLIFISSRNIIFFIKLIGFHLIEEILNFVFLYKFNHIRL